MVRLGTCRAPMVLAVVSAVWLPVMFFQLCDRLSHWGLNFHSAPSHQRLQLTMPAGLLTVRSVEGRSRKPLGRATCTEGFSAPIGWACAGSRTKALNAMMRLRQWRRIRPCGGCGGAGAVLVGCMGRRGLFLGAAFCQNFKKYSKSRPPAQPA